MSEIPQLQDELDQDKPIDVAEMYGAGSEATESELSYASAGSKSNGLRTHDSGVIGLHEDNLFDQNERSSDGAYIDEANGAQYDNSTTRDEDLFTGTGDSIGYTFNPEQGTPESIEGIEHLDAAALWLAEHDATTPGPINPDTSPPK